jgi:hypothetical protein
MSDAAPNLSPEMKRQKGFLGFVEKVGNFLPDPIMIFVWLIGLLMIRRRSAPRRAGPLRLAIQATPPRSTPRSRTACSPTAPRACSPK